MHVNIVELKLEKIKYADGRTYRHSHPVMLSCEAHCSKTYETWETQLKYVYCILASCYIRLTLNICSFVRQCNTFTS
jgi:hypothetical protein